MLQEASTNQKQFHLIKDFIKNLEAIVNHSANMQLQQWLLFGSWLEKYQSKCYFGDLTVSLNLIVLLLEKCSSADSWSFWECFFEDIVYQNLKQLSTMPSPPAIIGKIAGRLALCYNSLTNEAFSFFNSDVISPSIASMFLEVVLDSYPDNLILTREQEVMILQSWVKVCFLSIESQSELTKNVVKLDIFPPTLKHYLKTENEPMQAFIEYLGNNSKQLQYSSNDILKLCDLAFGNLDKTLQQYLSNPNDEKIVLKIYNYVSLTFLNCGNLIYNRNKPVTILTKLIQVLLLPMDFLVGKKTLHNFILNAVKRMWPTFFNSFINMLNAGKDPYLERTLKSMVVKYLPYFPTSDSPIVNSLDSPIMAEIILDKICLSYFKPPVKESDANVLKALKIVSDIASSTSSISLFKLVVNKTLHGLFEVVIFHQQRSGAIGVIKQITSSPLFSQVKSEFRQTVLAVTEKNIALNTINYFQLIICLAKFAPDDINSVLGDIRMHVGNAERLRGVGFDQSLRLHLERLENSLQSNC